MLCTIPGTLKQIICHCHDRQMIISVIKKAAWTAGFWRSWHLWRHFIVFWIAYYLFYMNNKGLIVSICEVTDNLDQYGHQNSVINVIYVTTSLLERLLQWHQSSHVWQKDISSIVFSFLGQINNSEWLQMD